MGLELVRDQHLNLGLHSPNVALAIRINRGALSPGTGRLLRFALQFQNFTTSEAKSASFSDESYLILFLHPERQSAAPAHTWRPQTNQTIVESCENIILGFFIFQ
jgi:hypothetical protein